MFSNNLNGAFEYESERRNDERRAALESQRGGAVSGRRLGLSAPRLAAVAFVLLIVLWHVF